MSSKLAQIEVFDRGYISERPASRGNRVVTQWKIVINIRPDKRARELGRFQQKGGWSLEGKRQIGIKDISKWVKTLEKEFKVSKHYVGITVQPVP